MRTLLITIILFGIMEARRADAQTSPLQIGLGVDFGMTSFRLASNYKELDDLLVAQEGGSLFIMGGTSALQFRGGVGFYYSSSRVRQTVDMRSAYLQSELRPMFLLTRKETRLAPYALTGVAASQQRFYGLYANQNERTNFSIARDPLIGTINGIDLMYGIGVAYSWPVGNQFLRLFSEFSGRTSLDRTYTSRMAETHISAGRAITFGVSFGQRY